MDFLVYMTDNLSQIITLIFEHLYLTSIAVILAILIGVPLGILISSFKAVNKPVLASANIIQAVPSMALLGFMIPFLGIGKIPAVIAVFLYSLLPIIKNTYTGISNINHQTIEAAKGIGLTKFQILYKIEIPLALPIIMTGVRVASVTAVGLMTIAAFIGAGGLGTLVFLGIRTVNNNQILAGAVPACVLALLVDFLLGLIENLVTPISLQKGDNAKLKKNRLLKKIAVVIIALIFVVLYFMKPTKENFSGKTTFSIGSKDYTEQALLSSLAAVLIENNTDIIVERKFDLGGTKVCFGALKAGDIDMYFEYTGTAYSDTLKHPPINDVDRVFQVMKDEFKNIYNIEVLEKSKFNNTYALAIRKDTAKKYNLKTVSDLAKIGDKLRFGVTFEFFNRKDGMVGLEKVYNFSPKSTITLDGSPRYIALNNLEIDVTDAFSTDGLLKKFDLVKMEDNLNFFPPYNVAPIIRADSLERFPEVKPLLNKLVLLLTDDVMSEMNYKIDELQMSPEEVATEFLIEKKLINKK